MQTSVAPRSRATRFIAVTIAALVVAVVAMLIFGVPALADTTFTFDGGGWGHGIGLSQWGSRGYALQGKTYDWILKHYYQGTSLKTMAAVTVKVNLEDNASARSQWQIKAGSSTALTVAQISDNTKKVTLDATNRYWITTANGNVSVRKDSVDSAGVHKPGALVKVFSGAAYASAGGFVQIVDQSGPFNHNGIVWRGTIRFFPSSTTASTSKAVNWVHIEDYLKGVVPRESPSSWPAEALKAQAVAARSYVYQDAKNSRVIYCTTMSQVYNGYAHWTDRSEADSTNAAILATNGKVVWYGSETQPVKTFFFSSSGGHTANVEDVWTSSDPKPYYTGVVDADQADPNYRWTVGPLTSAYVTDKVRTKDANGVPGLDYSEPSPATITGMTLERASSGYTHHITLKWSNGATHRIVGDTLRGALSMKSTHFSLRPIWTSREQTDSHLAWAGVWSNVSRTTDWGGSSRRSKAAESRLWVTYKGTGFAWVGTKSLAFGKAAVYIDGAYKTTVDLYSAKTLDRQTLYSISGQADATHTASIRVLGTKRASATGTWVDVDRVMVKSGSLVQATVPTTRAEDTSASLLRFGSGWSTWTWTYNGEARSALTTKSAKHRLVVSFVGDRIRWLSRTSSNRGIARVYVDGAAAVTVDTYSAAPQEAAVVWQSTALPWGSHTVVIEATGSHSAVSTDSWVLMDRFDLPGGAVRPASPRTTRTEESATSGMTWNGYWKQAIGSAYSGGSARYSATSGAGVTVSFTGTAVTWRGVRGPSLGKAAVYLDGKLISTVDCYSASTSRQVGLFSRTALSAGSHTLRVVALHQKSSSATGYNVYVDAFDVAGWIP